MKNKKIKILIVVLCVITLIVGTFLLIKLPQNAFSVPNGEEIVKANIIKMTKKVGENIAVNTYNTVDKEEIDKLFEISNIKVYNDLISNSPKFDSKDDVYLYIAFEISSGNGNYWEEISFNVGSDQVMTRMGEKQMTMFFGTKNVDKIQNEILKFFESLSDNSSWTLKK